MAKKGTDKKIALLEPSFRDILVCHDKKKKPFLEIFILEPEHISQENLGTLFGIFEITDNSEDSSYIVNFLISVIKKEFFLRPVRGSIESFEAALHKVNLALSKLAAHENVRWIGKLNSVCAVIEKNNLHIASAGTASAFFLRSKTLTELTEGPEDASPNPLKTFQDVLSGRMEEGDKIILATSGIFDIFSREEIKKSALKFSREDFFRFLNTALINELDSAAVLMADIDRKAPEIAPSSRKSKNVEKINAFSQSAFSKDPEEAPTDETIGISSEEKLEIKEKMEEIKSEFVDKRTGHIYIKESIEENEDQLISKNKDYADVLEELRGSAKEKLSGIGSSIKSLSGNIADSSALLIHKLKKKARRPKKEEGAIQTEAESESSVISEERMRALKDSAGAIWKSASEKARILSAKSKALILQTVPLATEAWRNMKIFFTKRLFPYLRRSAISAAMRYKRWQSQRHERPRTKPAAIPRSQGASLERFSHSQANRSRDTAAALSRNLIPDFKKLKAIVRKLDYSKRLYLILAVLAFFIIPYWIVKLQNGMSEKKADPTPSPAAPAQVVMLPLQEDANVIRIENIPAVYSGTDISNVVNLKGKIFAVSKTEVIDLESKNVFPIPQDFQNSDFAIPMNDLSLIFIMKNGRLTAWSPVSQKFDNNTLSLPGSAEIGGIGSYLTYLYVLDAKTGQIYRYPRAEGGFGTKTDWLKDATDLSQAQSMAINDNVFAISGSDILKFFRGKKQDFNPGQTATAVVPEKLYTDQDSENLFVLDTQNSRVVKYDKDGNIVSQFYNPAIGNAKGFSVNEGSSTIYLFTNTSVSSFAMGG